MNRAAVDPTDDKKESIAPTTTRAATSSPPVLLPTTSDHTSAALRRATVKPTKTAAGKRKRSRSEMTTASVPDSMHRADSFALKASPKRARPSLTESLHRQQSTHSDEDDDAVRFSVPPPPPTVPVPPELVCRYPNKPCPQERATKKHGELHSYCAYHRFKAQQYQRKLEQKKRERRLRDERSPSSQLAATSLSSSDAMLLRGLALEPSALLNRYSPPKKAVSPHVRRQGIRARTRSSPTRPSGTMYSGPRNPESSHIQSARPIEPLHTGSTPTAAAPATAMLEPFHHPVSLQEGDLQLLQVFLWDSQSPPNSDISGSSRPRAATVDPRTNHVADPRTRVGSNNAAYNVSLDGFTFTSESL